MMIKEFLLDKKHLAIFLLILSVMVLSFFLYKKPKEIIKTQVVTKVEIQTKYITVEKLVTKNIVTHKTIDRTTRNGTKTHIVETIDDTGKISLTSNEQDKSVSKEVSKTTEITKYGSDYLAGAYYTMPLTIIPNSFSPSQANVFLGKRLLSSPLFVTAGTNGALNSVSLGFIIEF